MRRIAFVVATVSLALAPSAGCAPADEGVLVVIHKPPNVDLSAGKLELFLGGPQQTQTADPARRRIRDVRAGYEDLVPVDTELEGFTIFLQGTPQDVVIAAIAVFPDVPAEPVDTPIAVGIADPLPFAAGQLTTVDVQLQPVRADGFQALRWRGAPVAGLDHSCLRWGTDGLPQQIVRDQDFDCDGTLPTDCSDPNQMQRNVPDDLPRQDADGDGHFTCDYTCGPNGDQPCDCNDDPQNDGASQYFGNPEVCDGRDNDCDPATFFTTAADHSYPCVLDTGGGGCEVGVLACDERLGEDEGTTCKETTTNAQPTCAVSIGTCTATNTCLPTSVPLSAAVTRCTPTYEVGMPCVESIDLPTLMGYVGGNVPTTCTAVLWGSDEVWRVALEDPTGGITARREIDDNPCTSIVLTVQQTATSVEPHDEILVVYDAGTGERTAIPMDMIINADTCDGSSDLACTPPM